MITLKQLGISLLCSGLGLAHGRCMTIYTFDGVTTQSGLVDPTPVPSAPGIVFGSFVAVGYEGNSAFPAKFCWKDNGLGATDGDNDFADFTGALDPQKYLEFTIAPEPSSVLDIDGFSFSVRRSATGVRNYAVRSSMDQFTANLPAFLDGSNTNLGIGPDDVFQFVCDGPVPNMDQNGSSIVLGSSFDAVSEPVTFRFYGWNAENSNGVFLIDNVDIAVTANTVPEPDGAGFVGLGLFMLLLSLRARGKATSAPAFQYRARPGPV